MTLQELQVEIVKLSHSRVAGATEFSRGFEHGLRTVLEIVEANMCSHPHARYESDWEGHGLMERPIFSWHKFCPDCGRELKGRKD